jgi:Leucine Rich repeat
MHPDTQVEVLRLGRNRIGKRGPLPLRGGALGKKNSTLTKLSLHDNNIDDEGISAIAEALKFTVRLHHLHLEFNNIGDVSGLAIAEAFKIKMRDESAMLQLNGNNISHAGAVAINKALHRRGMAVQKKGKHTLFFLNNCRPMSSIGSILGVDWRSSVRVQP